jgi:hypothetical protein
MGAHTCPFKYREIFVASVGNIIEWYDFYIFGSLAAVLSVKFFEQSHPVAALCNAPLFVNFRCAPFATEVLRPCNMSRRGAEPLSDTTSSPRISLPLSSSRRYDYGLARMSPRPGTDFVGRRRTAYCSINGVLDET